MVKKIFLPVIFILSLFLNLFFISKYKDFSLLFKDLFKNRSYLISGKAVKVIDGDTFDLEGGERIRLLEIDAPEFPKGCLGDMAKERLENLVLEKTLNLQKIKKDDFGRTLAYVYQDDLLINQIIIEEGLAFFRKDKKILTDKTLLLEKSQEKAKKLERGIWSSLCQTKKPGCFIKGNYRRRGNTRIYHTPDCYNYERIVIKPESQDRWFCSEEEAKKAGFVKSGDCPSY